MSSPDVYNAKAHTERYYTVGYAPNGMRGHPPPQITLKGHWLAALGFLTGQLLIVTPERSRLVIETEIKL